MNSCNEINFTQNSILQTKENRVIILTEDHTSKEAAETFQKILELASLKRLIALDEGLSAFRSGINECHLPLEDFQIKELGSVVTHLRDLRIYKASQKTGSSFIRREINDEKKISKYGIFVLRMYLNRFHHVYNSFLTNNELKNQLENKFEQEEKM